jgi:diketogulonate reductase-like aldo/keto reductase
MFLAIFGGHVCESRPRSRAGIIRASRREANSELSAPLWPHQLDEILLTEPLCRRRLSNEHLLNTAQRLGHTPAQIALAWLLNLAPNVLVIPGTSSVRHLEDNLAAADIKLDEQTQAHPAAATLQ